MQPILEIQDLRVSFRMYDRGLAQRDLAVISDLTLSVRPGEVVAVAGSSGSGKSLLASAILGLLPANATRTGEMRYKGEPLTQDRQKRLRGSEIALVPQSVQYLDPLMKVGPQADGHRSPRPVETRRRLFSRLGLPEGTEKLYPFQLSGGMAQRVTIALAACSEARLLIADEPTTALDVTIQAQILDLLRNLKNKINSSIMLITHDLGVIAEMADYVVVMYAGRVVEKGTVQEIFANPSHPYTIGLMASKPVIGKKVDKLYSIPGKVPNPVNMPDYCYFRDRCEMRCPECDGKYPCEISLSETHKVSCYRYYDKKEGK